MKAKTVFNFPETIRNLIRDTRQLFSLIEKLNGRLEVVEKDVSDNKQVALENSQALAELSSEIRSRYSEIEHAIRAGAQSGGAKKTSTSPDSAGEVLFADNHALDSFYLEFENHFRGSEKEIAEKQLPCIKILQKAKFDKKLPVVDLGCGRGEFLDLLEHHGFSPLGVDLNGSMVEHARELGHKAEEADAISFLTSQKANSLGAITGFHLAEHIPFDHLLILLSEAHRCLAPGGVLVLETPNPESLYVGAFTFHYDPSHLKPIPPAIMQFSAKFKGFATAEILRTQPELSSSEIKKATENPILQDALKRLYGPRDYSLVATK